MREGKIFLELKNQLIELERLGPLFAALRQRRHLPAEALFDMHLALEEIITNVISYGFEGQGEHHIRVSLFLEQGELRAEVEDDGAPFNPLETPSPDTAQPLQDRTIRGLGIHLIRNLMDEIVYQRQEGRNVLVMKKRVRT